MHIVTTVDSRNIQIKNDNNRFQNYQDDELNFRQDTPKRFSFGEKDRPKDFRFGEHDDRDGDIETRNYHDRRGGGNRRNFRGRGRSGGDHYNENRADHYNRQESRNSNEEYYDKRDFRNSGDFSRQDSRGRGRGRNDHRDHYNRQDSRSSGEDIYDKRDFRNSGDFSRHDSRGRGGQNYKGSSDGNQFNRQGSSDGNQYNRQGSRDSNGNRYSGEFKRNNYKDKREQFDDSEFEPTRKRAHGGSHNYHDDRTHGGSHNFHDDRTHGGSNNYHDDEPEGPPPDPSYNFLSDRSREGPQMHAQERREPARRHPKNFGGQDFSNVKNQMKNVKERQQNRPGHQKSKMELAVTMTGKERRQYIEWKADRDRVDIARIERQKSSSGEWKREWDKEKFESDEIKNTEPGKRPAGRIGSGRFDRGEKDERQKGEMTEDAQRGKSEKGHQRPETPTKVRGDAPIRGHGNRHPETPPRMAGRGRGRGRGKAKSANEAKPQRIRSTSSGDERVVNCDSDLLVIKLENTPGDNSVEVEYSDGEVPPVKSTRVKQGGSAGTGAGGTTASHGAQTEELWWDEDDDLTMSLIQDGLDGDEILEHRQLFDDVDHERPGSHEIIVDDDEDEWEDCDDDSYYSTEKSQTSTDSREGDKQLRVNTQLNPDAPEFTPTSPLSPASPRSPREKRESRKTAKPKRNEQTGKESLKPKEQSHSKTAEIRSPKESKESNAIVENNSKSGQDAADQKGTNKKDTKCDIKVQNETETMDNNSQKSSEDNDVSKNLENGTDMSKTGDACHQDGGISDPQITQSSSDTDDKKAHSETSSGNAAVDSTSIEGTVTGKNKEGITNVESGGEPTTEVQSSAKDTTKVESGAEDITEVENCAQDTTNVESGVQDTKNVESGTKDTTNVESGAQDTTNVESDAEDTTNVTSGVEDATKLESGAKDTTETDNGVGDSTNEQMAVSETKENVDKERELDVFN